MHRTDRKIRINRDRTIHRFENVKIRFQEQISLRFEGFEQKCLAATRVFRDRDGIQPEQRVFRHIADRAFKYLIFCFHTPPKVITHYILYVV